MESKIAMKRHPKLAILPLGLFGVLAVLVWVPSLRVSLPEMKSRAALKLDFGSSRAQVETFLRAQHLPMEATTANYTPANGAAGSTRLMAKARLLLAAPLYFRFYFANNKLVGYTISDKPIGGEVGG